MEINESIIDYITLDNKKSNSTDQNTSHLDKYYMQNVNSSKKDKDVIKILNKSNSVMNKTFNDQIQLKSNSSD